jgi:hypothetical protein
MVHETHNEWTEYEVAKIKATLDIWRSKGSELTFRKSEKYLIGCYQLLLNHWDKSINEVMVIGIHKILAGPGFFKNKSIWVAELSIIDNDGRVDEFGCVEVDGPMSALDIGTNRLDKKFRSKTQIKDYFL